MSVQNVNQRKKGRTDDNYKYSLSNNPAVFII